MAAEVRRQGRHPTAAARPAGCRGCGQAGRDLQVHVGADLGDDRVRIADVAVHDGDAGIIGGDQRPQVSQQLVAESPVRSEVVLAAQMLIIY